MVVTFLTMSRCGRMSEWTSECVWLETQTNNLSRLKVDTRTHTHARRKRNWWLDFLTSTKVEGQPPLKEESRWHALKSCGSFLSPSFSPSYLQMWWLISTLKIETNTLRTHFEHTHTHEQDIEKLAKKRHKGWPWSLPAGCSDPLSTSCNFRCSHTVHRAIRIRWPDRCQSNRWAPDDWPDDSTYFWSSRDRLWCRIPCTLDDVRWSSSGMRPIGENEFEPSPVLPCCPHRCQTQTWSTSSNRRKSGWHKSLCPDPIWPDRYESDDLAARREAHLCVCVCVCGERRLKDKKELNHERILTAWDGK